MKKVRIMLAAIVVLGSVGGALAFKAKTFGSGKYCTTSDLNSPTCPLPALAVFVAGNQVKYTTTDNTTRCTTAHPACEEVGIQQN